MVVHLTFQLLSIYLFGVVVSFFICRMLAKDFKGKALVLTEYIIIAHLALLSWISFTAYLIYFGLVFTDIIDPDKECKW